MMEFLATLGGIVVCVVVYWLCDEAVTFVKNGLVSYERRRELEETETFSRGCPECQKAWEERNRR